MNDYEDLYGYGGDDHEDHEDRGDLYGYGGDRDRRDSDKDSGDEWKGELGDGLGSFKDRQRAGGSINTCWDIGIDGEKKKIQTPLGRFCVSVDGFARGMGDVCNISDDDIRRLLDRSQRLNRVQYKNPTAFVLGFLATQGGTVSVNKESLRRTWQCYCQKICNSKTSSCYNSCVQSSIGFNEDESRGHGLNNIVQKPDIIRYARLWVTPS